MVEYAVLLEECAKAAAAAFGKQLAESFMDAVLNKLATKEDLDRAVAELKRYIALVIDQLEKDLIGAGLYAATTHLRDFKTSRHIDIHQLDGANSAINHSFGLLRAQATHDPDVYRRYFVPITKMIVTDLSVWIDYSVYKSKKHIPTLKAHIADNCLLIEECIKRIEEFEHEVAGPIYLESGERGGRGETPPFKRIWASFNVTSRRYGTRHVSSRHISGDDDARIVIDEATRMRTEDLRHIDDRARLRKETVYDPARKFCSSVKTMKLPSYVDAPSDLDDTCKMLFIDIANSYLTAGAKQSEAIAAAQKAVDDFKVE